MRMRLMTCKQWDVAVVPFPFVDTRKSKPRPVLILSNENFIEETGHSIAAMITSAEHAQWLGDTSIINLEESGLKKNSIIRLKLFTLDMRFEPRVIGQLSKSDKANFMKSFSKGAF